ncbi:MAG: endonuclease/exonuclease/phosphatase family protein [Clostridia bacterium]|nr:endonuclease/exonuclease/phosphatase family protein [Clostridia bacterium]
MKIMTFNVQHCASYLENGKIDFSLFAETIRKSGAEIVGLNEMRGKGEATDYEAQTEILSSLSGMPHAYFAPAIMVRGQNPYGNALLSKHKLLSARKIMIPDPPTRVEGHRYETRCMLKARLACGLTVAVVHVGLNRDEQACAICTLLEEIEDERFVLMGDFNMTPDDPLLAPIRDRLLDTALLTDAPLLTYPSDAPNQKIDYIFASRDLHVTSVRVPEWVVSDHRPYLIEIE